MFKLTVLACAFAAAQAGLLPAAGYAGLPLATAGYAGLPLNAGYALPAAGYAAAVPAALPVAPKAYAVPAPREIVNAPIVEQYTTPVEQHGYVVEY